MDFPSPRGEPPPAAGPPLIPTLPDDVAIQILARTPRMSHPNLSLVCSSWRSLLRSPHFFAARAGLGLADPFLFVSIRIHASSLHWFLLPTDALPRALRPLPPIPVPALGSAAVAAGPRIFVLGGSVNEIPTPNVWVFDARLWAWSPGPCMRVSREFPAAGVVAGGGVYVMGGCLVDSWARSASWAEVLLPGAAGWAPVASPAAIRERWMHGSAVLAGKVYAMADRGGVVFDPEDDSWGLAPKHLDLGWRGRAAVVDGVLYCYDYLGKIRGYLVERDEWKELKGIGKELPRFLCGASLANVGGRLVVVWEGKERGREVDVWCAEIQVSKDGLGELKGSVVWSEKAFAVPKGSSIVHCVAVEF